MFYLAPLCGTFFFFFLLFAPDKLLLLLLLLRGTFSFSYYHNLASKGVGCITQHSTPQSNSDSESKKVNVVVVLYSVVQLRVFSSLFLLLLFCCPF